MTTVQRYEMDTNRAGSLMLPDDLGDYVRHDDHVAALDAERARAERAEAERDEARATQRELHRRAQESESTAYQKLRSNFFSGEASLPDTLEGWRIAAARRMRDYLMVRDWWRTDCDLYRGQRDAERSRAERAEAEVERLKAELSVMRDLDASVAGIATTLRARAEAAETERSEAVRKLDLSLRAWEARNDMELVGDDARAWLDLMESDDAAKLLAETRNELDGARSRLRTLEEAAGRVVATWGSGESLDRAIAIRALGEALKGGGT